MRPVYRLLPSRPEWERLPLPATHSGGKTADLYKELRSRGAVVQAPQDEFVLRFEYTVEEAQAEETLYFAFCFPLSYTGRPSTSH